MSDIDKLNPAVTIVLDKERRLLLNLNAMAAFEKAAGKSLFALNTEQLSATDLRSLIWACLLHEDRKLTEEMVGEWITPANMAEIAARLTQAFTAAMPAAKEETPTSPLAETPQTQ